MTYSERLNNLIPGGCHTYSRGDDQYPENAPQIFERGEGAYTYTPDGKEFLDYGMALRAVTIGYGEKRIANAAIEQIWKGNNLTRASVIELEAAEAMVDLIPSVDMVKFAKNRSTVTSAAVKMARAYTGRKYIIRCFDHPFFSYDDWFIGDTVITRGIPKESHEHTVNFRYNDIQSLEVLFAQHPNEVAGVILEPATTEHPKDNFLQKVRDLCHKNGALFILDEMITGFRWHLQGAQTYYGVEPDLCTFGAEMSGLGALVETIKFYKEHDVIGHLWDYGTKIVAGMNAIAKELGIEDYFSAGGIECSPYYLTKDANKEVSMAFRTLFSQEMIKNGVLMPVIVFSYAHKQRELDRTFEATRKALQVYKKALEEGVEKYLVGEVVKPVFRKYN